MLSPGRRPGPADRGPSDRRPADRGSTLVELSVAIMVFGIFAAAVASTVLSMMRVAARTAAVANASTQLRDILDGVGHTLPAASQVNAPTEVGSDWYLEALSPPTPATITATCTQWRLLAATDQFQVRTWNTVNPLPTAWRTVGTGIVNDPAGQPPFAVTAPDTGFADYRVSLQLYLAEPDVGTVDQRADFALRNSTTGTAGPVCTQVGRP